jgi:tetratricopeptide (TPR) repeat protein
VAALRHPNIVQVFDFDLLNDNPYMVMEWVQGESLAERLLALKVRDARISLGEAGYIVRKVGEALGYAHQRGMVHRDVKPSNIMLEAGLERPVLMDFGIAKMMHASHKETSPGLIVGTPAYMAPEQIDGQELDGRADQYALGVMVYEMLTGELPYDSERSIFSKILKEAHSFRAGLPEPVAAILRRCLADKPTDRYPSLTEMLAQFSEALLGQGSLLENDAHWLERPSPTGLKTKPLDEPIPTRPLAGTEFEPPQPTVPPTRADIVSRATELRYFEQRLDTYNLVFISGMPGVGKTTLAAGLARQVAAPHKIFWHTFHAGESVMALVWKLAGFLYWHDQPQLWQRLQALPQTGSASTPPEVLLDYLFQNLRGHGYVLCLDDFHFVTSDSLLGEFMEGLQELTAGGEISLIIASRHLPELVEVADTQPLPGFSRTDMEALLGQRGLTLAPDALEQLWTLTEGNAQLLMLVLNALRRANDPTRFLARLPENEHIERFLIKEVDAGLTHSEREIMMAVAVLLGWSGTREALATLLDGRSVRAELNGLLSRNLLDVQDGEWAKEYSLHPLLQAFYYDLLDKHTRQTLHQRAAEFYTQEELEPLRAARHHQRAGQSERAALLITDDVWPFINRGQGQALRQVLAELRERDVPALLWARVLLARGQVLAVLGEGETAQATYTQADDVLAEQPDSRLVRELRARTCRGLGELLQETDSEAALAWLRRGLAENAGASPLEEAALHIRLGRILAYTGQPDAARPVLEQGLALLPNIPSRLRMSALGNLGNLYCEAGQREKGLAYYHEVLATAEKLQDRWTMVEVWLNLGIQADMIGAWPTARQYYQQALEEAERLGSANQQARALLNLGHLLWHLGEDEAALNSFERALTLAQRKSWPAEQAYATSALLKAKADLADWEAVARLLPEATRLAEDSQAREPVPDIERTRSLAALAQNDPVTALAAAERALTAAQALQSLAEEGQSYRVLALVHWAAANPAAAQAAFERSYALLVEQEPYEAARTQVAQAQCSPPAQARPLLEQALATFERLGAQRDARLARTLLAG